MRSCVVVVACSYLSELRRRLECELGFPLRESNRPDLADFVGPRLHGVRVSDAELLALGAFGNQGRALWAARLSQSLNAQVGAVEDFRPLWLSLESLIFHGSAHRLGRLAETKTRQGLDCIWERESLAGRQQGQLRYPRLAQWALLAGGLERSCKS